MEDHNEITGFSSWLISSGEGVIYLEGVPTAEERAKNLQRTAEIRKTWKPDDEAIDIYKRMKLLEGKQITIQLWDNLMELCPDEGPFPFLCEVINVFIKRVESEGKEFEQLFVEFKNPVVIDNGNKGDNPIFESNLNSPKETFIYNCSRFYFVSCLN
jgi:hypothetical protein